MLNERVIEEQKAIPSGPSSRIYNFDQLSNDTLVDNVASASEFATKTFLRRRASRRSSQQSNGHNEEFIAKFGQKVVAPQ